jgi:hypothetical protein
MILIPFSIEKVYSLVGSMPPPSLLISYTHTNANLYFDSSLGIIIKEPALYKLLTFQVPILLSIFHRLGHLLIEPIQVRSSVNSFVTSLYFLVRGCWPHAHHPRWRITLSFVCSCLLNVFVATSIAGGSPSSTT